MTHFFTMASDTIASLKKDRASVVIAVAFLFAIICSHVICSWAATSMQRVLYDVGFFAFDVILNFAAILWALSVFDSSQGERFAEYELVRPVPRWLWVVAKFAGVGAFIFAFTFFFICLWSAFLWLNSFPLSWEVVYLFFLRSLSAYLLLALSFFLLSFAGFGVALFAAVSMWFVANIISLLSLSMAEGQLWTKLIVDTIATIWNFKSFSQSYPSSDFAITYYPWAWAATVVVFFLASSCFIFTKKDII
jgi:hypothetical protein